MDKNNIEGTTVTFHDSLPIAASDTSHILNGENLIINSNQVVYAMITDTITGCSDVANFAVEIESCCPDSLHLTGSENGIFTYKAREYIESDQALQQDAHITYNSGFYITLLKGFEIRTGAEFDALLEGCPEE